MSSSEKLEQLGAEIGTAPPPKPKTPPAPNAGEENTKKPPPVLDSGRKAEVKAEWVKVIGSVTITIIGLASLLSVKGLWDWAFFGTLLMFNIKDPLINLVSFMTGAKAAQVTLSLESAKAAWEDEREQLRLKLTEQNVAIAKLEAQLEAARQ